MIRNLFIACVCITALASTAHADDKYSYGSMPTVEAQGADAAPEPDSCPAEQKLEKCYADLENNQTVCDEQIDAYAVELAGCLGTTEEVVKEEMGKDKDKRKWRKQKGDKPQKPAAPRDPKPTKPKAKKPGEVKRHVTTGPTADCAAGGTLHEYGLDKDRDGQLDDDEVDSAQTWMTCNGLKGDKGDPGATGETGAKGDKGDRGERGADGRNGRDGSDTVKVGLGMRSTIVSGAGEEPAYLTAPVLTLHVGVTPNVEWSAEAGLALWGDNGTVASTSVGLYTDAGIGMKLGVLGQWIGYDETNHARAQALVITPGVVYRNGGFRADVTATVGVRGAYGAREQGAYGLTFGVSFGL